MPESKYNALLEAANARAKEQQLQQTEHDVSSPHKKLKSSNNGDEDTVQPRRTNNTSSQGGSYSVSEAQAAYSHLSDYHKKKGWDTSGWWSRKG